MCHLSHNMLRTVWDPIVFTSMENIQLNRSSQSVWRSICVYSSGIHKIGAFVSLNVLYKLCLKINISKILKTVYWCSPFANMGPVIVWLFLELWDTVY